MQILTELARTALIDTLLRATRDVQKPGGSSPRAATATSVTSLQLTAVAEEIMQLLEKLLPTPEVRSQELPVMLRFAQQAPDLLDSFTRVLGTLVGLGASEETLSESIDMMGQMGRLVSERASSPGAKLGSEQQAGQWMREVETLLNAQESMPPSSRATTAEMIRFLSLALRESPDTFEQELFAVPVFQKAGFDLTTYQMMADQVEPARIALLMIASDNKGDPALKNQMFSEMRQALSSASGGLADKPLLPVVEKWEKIFKPQQPLSTRELNIKFHTLKEGLALVPEGRERGLVIQALSRKTGLLPDRSWQIGKMADIGLIGQTGEIASDMGNVGLLGSLLLTQAFPAGLHRLKCRVRDNKCESFVEFLLYVVQGLSEEEEESQGKEKNQKRQRQGYDPVEIETVPSRSVGGSIDLSLNAPVILMAPYQKDSVIPAPLQVSFKFLANIVDPKTLFSRRSFLTLAESAEAADFRRAVHLLSAKGLAAYDGYVRALQNLFEKIESAIPSGRKSLDQARQYLRNEVLLYITGQSEGGDKQAVVKMMEKSPKGDVMASICATAAGVLARADRVGDALIQFADASAFAESRPYFMEKLEDFFSALRKKGAVTGGRNWDQKLPLLPPSAKPQTPSGPYSTTLAEQFVTNLKTVVGSV